MRKGVKVYPHRDRLRARKHMGMLARHRVAYKAKRARKPVAMKARVVRRATPAKAILRRKATTLTRKPRAKKAMRKADILRKVGRKRLDRLGYQEKTMKQLHNEKNLAQIRAIATRAKVAYH